MGAKLAKGADALRAPSILRGRSTSRIRGGEDDEPFEDLSGKRSFESLYTLGSKLGAGTYADVFQCTHRRSGKTRAVKVVLLDRLTHEDDLRALEEEIEILSKLQHKCIVRLYHVFRVPGKVYLVQELCAGGELFDRIVAKRNYCENDARELLRRALEALAYAHGKGVVHRDLKPENILLASPDDDVELKLADFGMARSLSPKLDMLTTICGSPGYMAPEIIKQEPYDEKVDIWALGVILFCMLGGYNPFDASSTAMVFARIRAHSLARLRFDGSAFQSVTEDAKDLVRHMLAPAPHKRISAIAALQHRWFHVHEAKLMRHDLTATRKQLKEYRKNARFRAAANAVVMANRLKVLSSGRSLSGSVSGSLSASSSGVSRERSGSSGSTASSNGSGRGVSGGVNGVGESKHVEFEEPSSKGRGDSLGSEGSDGGTTTVATGYASSRAPSASGSGNSRRGLEALVEEGPAKAQQQLVGVVKGESVQSLAKQFSVDEGEEGEELKTDTDTWV